MEKRRGDHWGIIIGTVALIFASAIFGQSAASKGADAPAGSSYSKQVSGLSAIYAVLEGYGRASRWERTPDKLSPEVSTLVIWDPGDLDQDAWRQALNWVGNGKRLVVGGTLIPEPWALETDRAGKVQPAAATPLTAGLGELSMGGGVFVRMNQPALVHLAKEDGTPVLVSWAHREGRVYWSADPEWLTNARIGQGQNLTLALRLLGDQGTVAFDEYSHGFRAIERWWQILRGELLTFTVQLSAALALLFWAFGARFGSPRPVLAVTPRAAVEYVYSMSHLYRQARARTMVARGLYRSLTRTLGRLLGGARGLSHMEIARRTAERTGLPTEQIAGVLNRLAPENAQEPNERELIAAAREVEEIQRRVRNAGHRNQ